MNDKMNARGRVPDFIPATINNEDNLHPALVDGGCRFLLLLVFLILLQIIAPPSLRAMDLIEAYTLAKDHDPAFGSARYGLEASRTQSQQARSFLLPQVQATGSFSNYDFNSAPASYLDYTGQNMGVNLRQPLFNIPKFYEYRQYNIRGTIGDVRFATAEQDLMLRVAEAYFRGLAAVNLLELIDSEKKAVAEQREQAREMFQAGVGTITDVHEAEARYDAVLSKEIEAANNLDIKKRALMKIVGTDPGELKALREDIPLSIPEPETLEGWIEKAKEHHPVLKSYVYQIEYQEAELRKNQGQHWPSVDLVAGYTMTNTSNLMKTQDINYSTVGVQVNLPVFSGGYVSAKVKESRAMLGQVKKEYEKSLSDITEKLGEAFLGIRGSIAKRDALRAAVRSASTALHSNKMGMIAGVRTTTDILNAQRELNDIQVRLLQARYDYLINIVKLKSSSGTLAGDDLLAINQWLQK